MHGLESVRLNAVCVSVAQKFRQMLSSDPDMVLNGYRLQEQKCPVLRAIVTSNSGFLDGAPNSFPL